jgi:hypothetical protein
MAATRGDPGTEAGLQADSPCTNPLNCAVAIGVLDGAQRGHMAHDRATALAGVTRGNISI